MAEPENDTMSSNHIMETTVERIAREAGRIALAHFQSLATLPVEEKGHLDLVTGADREVEDFLIAALREAFPEDGVFGEEGGDVCGVSGRIWVIDPIDGTFNFVRGSQNWAISIGLFENREPVFGAIFAPARDLMITGGTDIGAKINGKPMPLLPAFDLSRASTGIGIHPSIATNDRLEVFRFLADELRINFRCCGSSALSLMEIAMGETDGYVALGDSTWDVMAGLPILAGLGVSHTIEWGHIDLREKLRFACGGDAFLTRMRPLLDKVSVAA
ncbi:MULTISPECIES: inositol monophosphatase family protein [unclassified Neorhizobium]|uniref:inositol monophosphatase family protein n=1 Tax=unclassified Neorhizobium TaxID=2629175 RepID=UPI001FF5F731|nr:MULTISPECIES: inositol monophosphatase family protein [unclassified Neorhizobium]MCJ9672222.1 inositol monophosphatase [Neorhizobium sp. SHOUNA12B]MCJ9748051.1 inositol monophosphatase [Neorhizobium sp. SHOUNA12A]